MVKISSLIVRAFFSATALLTSSLVLADSDGSSVYTRALDNEANGYARVIQLQHAGEMNGKLLTTWEHWYTIDPHDETANGSAGNFIIREKNVSSDKWTTLTTVHDPQKSAGHPSPLFYQPFLFEFPQHLGKYPEGTLLLVGNLSNGSHTEFFTWRSPDHGKTWNPVGPWQYGAATGNTGGIWEPFLYLDSKGRLVALFSDERDMKTHHQMLVHVVSEDGGDTWGKVVRDVASSNMTHRPGMASVARMDNGEYFMSYEFCRKVNADCPVHGKTSPDGVSWNETDVGNAITTADGISLWASPYTIWDPSSKQLVMGSNSQFLDNTNNFDAPQIRRTVFINKQHGKGQWEWSPSPWAVPKRSDVCASNRSPDLLPLSDGVVRYTAASNQDGGLCSERTGIAPVGVLPYKANFSTNGQAGWINFGGNWSTSGDQYRFTSTQNITAVAVTGSSGWVDYKISAEVMISDKTGVAGLSARVSASKTGLNSLKKYTAAINTDTGNLTISREANDSIVLHTQAHPGGIQGNKWYHLSFAVRSNQLTVMLSGDQGGSNISHTSTDGSFPQGLAGLYGENGSGSFKNVQITNLDLKYMAVASYQIKFSKWRQFI